MESIGLLTILSLVVIGVTGKGPLTGTFATIILDLFGLMGLRSSSRLLRYIEKRRSEGGSSSSVA